jgi:hypothetical protein
MGQFNFKNRIFAGPADGATRKPRIANKSGIAALAVTAALMPGKMVTHNGTTFVYSSALDFAFDGKVVKEKATTRTEGDILGAFVEGENYDVIEPISGDFINGLVASASTVAYGAGFTTNATGYFTPAATDGTENVLYIAEEGSAPGADRLVRFRKL